MALEVSTGTCDLCGAISDATVQECNILACTFQHCEGGLYHQECLEKYLKANKLEKNRKTGFKCPRGCGKGTKWPEPCPGRIDKSHPIHPRNEDKKKTKLAAVVVEPQRPGKAAAPAAANGKPGKGKEEAKADAGKDAKGAAAKAAPAATKAAPAAAAAAPAAKTLVVKKEPAVLPPRPEVVAKQKLAEQVALARRELGLGGSAMPSTGSKGDLQGMVGAGATKASAAASTSAASAWGKPTAPPPEPVSLQPTTLAQLPQFHQLLQQAVNKKTAAAAKTAAPAAAPAPAPTAAKPAPAVPQPVLNPPTPVWPALGAVQTSAAALLSSASLSTQQTPREGSARPASPPSAWGQAAAPVPATPVAAAAAATPAPAQVTSASNSPSLPMPPAGSARSGTTTPTPAPAPAAQPAATATTASSAATTTQAGLAAGVAGSGLQTSTSGRSLASSDQASTSTVATTTPAAAAAAALQRGQALVGAEYADEEVKETKLTKAQKKNLKRSEKKKLESGPEGEEGAAGEGEGAAAAATAAGSGSDPRQAVTSTSAAAAATRRSGGGAASGSASASHQRVASRGSDDPDQAADAEAAAVMEELCINSIVARKVLALITQLQRLGAPEFVAAAAVQRYGSNVMSALEWLLVAGADAAASSPEVVLAAAAESPSAAASEVDISEELQQLSDLQAAMGVPTELLQQCMVDCNGDVQAAANVALERLLAAPSGSAASLRGAAGNSRSGSPAVRGSGSGAMQLQPSASFYSVSSLDGSAAEAAASAAAASAKPRSHFGVRLQDDPVEGDGGAGATAGGGLGGYGDYASGLLRGSVVLGASGWANGYGSTASPGAGATASAAGNGAVAGSRLSRWLRDESGHGAGQDEEAAAAGPSSSRLRNGLLSPTDPVLESPFASHSDMARGLAASGKAATSETPSLGSWLSSNGYHHSMGLGHGGQPSGTGHFSFVSAMSKPTASMAAGGGGGGGLEPLAEYGSRWSSSLATPAHPMPPPGFGGRGGGAAEAEAVQHGDIGGEGDLASIMGLINGK
ncbi:hypothetical protein CHLRE_03g169650v5 [Chlamydomonas reinhardtii]|uniref:UBA domain-containing protein n=1 Tax=Chlamydomonas reinhardtii TaxID=3055 RepID=A0A2K3DWZ1_CHLRE|nr:uncharacterized protein CHLRE_03g169650v5 [Chlamydomonas reinhardtii]PNW85052.1 hypothetical protein CHLRE_03g169650v5 [Chlamydomonas reinhardtii]